MIKQCMSKRSFFTLCVLLLVGVVPGAFAQDNGAADEPLTRREFDAFLKEYETFRAGYEKLEQENAQLRKRLDDVSTNEGQADGWRAELDVRMAQERETILEQVEENLRDRTDGLLPGSTNVALGGGYVAFYQDREDVDSTFGTGIAPFLALELTDRLLLEAEFGFGLSRDDTTTELGAAFASYVVNDYVTLGAGLFRFPFGTFWERWHPSWINKSTTIPLIYEAGIVPSAGLGVQLRGGASVGDAKVNYVMYLVNGPDFRTSQVSAGRIGLGNFRDNNNNKGFGGRVGILPIPELELGYSFFTGRVGDSGGGFSRIDTVMNGFDLTYTRDIDAIKGRLDLRAEVVWVDTDDTLAVIEPLQVTTLTNDRSGWFVQAAYRPTKIDGAIGGFEFKKMEFVLRYDQLRETGPGSLGTDRDRISLGLDYWFRPNAVLKGAFVHDNVDGGEDQNAFLLQLAIGL